MTLLVRTPHPHTTESLFGFVLRVSEENGYDTPHYVWSIARVPLASALAPRLPIEPLATILGLDSDTLKPLAYRGKFGGRGSYKVLGHPLGNSLRGTPLRLRRAVFCPQCVLDTGYIDVFWDLTAAVACPFHGSMALNICPMCTQAIRWKRPGLLTCACGASLADAHTPPAPPPVRELMKLVYARLHGTSVDAENPSELPLVHLASMPFSMLLHLIAVLGRVDATNVGEEASATHSSDEPTASTTLTPGSAQLDSRAARTAQILSDWPQGYHRFLRELGERNLASGMATVGIAKQFSGFYRGLFKIRLLTREYTGFLHDEFVAFGLHHWGKGIVNHRMMRDKNLLKDARFVSLWELQKRHRLGRQTVRMMTDSGTLAGITVNVKGTERGVVDTRNTRVRSTITKRLRIKQAARQLGLTVRVLRQLRRIGIYQATAQHGYPWWYADEVERFGTRLLALGQTACGSISEGLVTLSEVIRKKRPSLAIRVAIVTALLEGALTPCGRISDNPGGLLLKRQDIDAFIDSSRKYILGRSYSFKECAAMIGLDRSAISEAVKSHYLVETVVRAVGEYKRITAESVERFQSKYLPLAMVARENGTSAPWVAKVCRERGLPIMFIARPHQNTPQGFIARSHGSQLAAALAEAAAKQERSHRARKDALDLLKERLRAYCARMLESGQGIPRRGGVPVRRTIARECGFNRDVFYDRPHMQRLLDEFDRKECDWKREKCGKPVEIVKDYLAKLRKSGSPLPSWRGRLNVLQIAKQCGISRQAIQRNSKVMQVLNKFVLERTERPTTKLMPSRPAALT